MIDILKIASTCKLYNFHTHTQFCDGHACMEDFVTAAIATHFSHLGFTPHSPIPFPTSCNMDKSNVQVYLDEIQRLREKYGTQISIYAAMEIDYLDHFGPSSSFFDSIPLDYRIGSVHFIPSFQNPEEYVDIDGHIEAFKLKMHRYFNDDIESVVRSFYRQSMAMIEKGGFDIIGHFDKIGFNASMFKTGIDREPWYDKLVTDEFHSIMDHHLIIEINTKSWQQYQRFFPDARYFELLRRYKAPVVFNSDAHVPAKINAGRIEAMKTFGLAMQ